MFSTIVHQTLQDRGNPEYVENNGPFAMKNSKTSYLGNGYYFWDNHIELSKWWGKTHCGDKYIICQGNFEIKDDDFCDLVGSRTDQIYFQEIVKELNLPTLTMGAAIEMLRSLNLTVKRKGIFPYKSIRAVDLQGSSFGQYRIKFADKEVGGLTTLNPRIIICLFKKEPKILTSYKIIYPAEYVA